MFGACFFNIYCAGLHIFNAIHSTVSRNFASFKGLPFPSSCLGGVFLGLESVG